MDDLSLGTRAMRSLTILTGLFVIAGVLGLVDLARSLAAGEATLNFSGPLFLAIGYGLWRRHPTARITALTVAWFFAALAPIFVILYFTSTDPTATFMNEPVDPYSPAALGILIGTALTLVLIAAWTIRVLTRDAVRSAFADETD